MARGSRPTTSRERSALTIPRYGYEARARIAEGKLNVARAAAHFFFPTRCLACKRRPVERFLRGGTCARCWETLPSPASDRCDVCDETLIFSSPEISRCGRCLLSPPPYRRLRAAAPYRGSAREILIALKFGGADFLAPRLAKIMTDRLGAPGGAPCDSASSPGGVDAVACVPATARARLRGDHAADLLAASLAERLGIAYSPRLLEKRRATERQSGLALARRAANVRGAFRARSRAPERVLLVDDVATSGATARECARILLAAGARQVEVWCFARASREDLLLDDRERRAPHA